MRQVRLLEVESEEVIGKTKYKSSWIIEDIFEIIPFRNKADLGLMKTIYKWDLAEN